MQADSPRPSDPSLPSRYAERFCARRTRTSHVTGIGLAGVRRGGMGRNLSGTAGIAFTRLKENVLLGAFFILQ